MITTPDRSYTLPPPTTALLGLSRTGPLRLPDEAADSLKFVERLNFGATFSPIDGVYVPTEATYNLMFVLNVPQFRNKTTQWVGCVKNAKDRCIGVNVCAVLTPVIKPARRSAVKNLTCALLTRFVSHLQESRKVIALQLLQQLDTYINLSVELAEYETRDRSKRELKTDDAIGWNAHHKRDLVNSINTVRAELATSCYNISSFSDRLLCMTALMQLEFHDKLERDIGERFKRSAAESVDDRFITRFTNSIGGLLDQMNDASDLADKIDEAFDIMNAPHLGQWEPESREPRGLFNLGGKILGSLFGVVTADEAKDMKAAISTLADNQFKIGKKLVTFEKRVVAAAELMNDHLKSMENKMDALDSEFRTMFDDLFQGLHASSGLAAFAASSLITLTQDVVQVQNDIQEFLVGLRALQRSELAMQLISEPVLRKSLMDLQDHIVSKYSYFSVAELDPVYYYKYAKPAFTWQDGTLIVYLSVPLRSTHSAFKLYQVSVVNIPADKNDSLETRLVLRNDIFGISHDGINFLEMKKEDLNSCTLSQTIRCEMAIVIRDVYHQTCSLAIFQNDAQAIRELCSYRLEAARPVLDMSALSPGRVLISNAETVAVQCPGRSAVTRPGCVRCIWQQPCGCGLSVTDGSSKSVSLSPTLHGCNEDEWSFKVEYPVNFPALSRFLDAEVLKSISHEDYVTAEADVPDIDFQVHPLAKNMSMHDRYHFSMDIDQAVANLKNDEDLHPFHLREVQPDTEHGTWLMSLTVTGGTMVGLGAMIYMLLKMHKRGVFAKLWGLASHNNDDPDTKPDDDWDEVDPSGSPDIKDVVSRVICELAKEKRRKKLQDSHNDGGAGSNGPPTERLYPTDQLAQLQ